jgi:hypothetical protein
VGDPGRLRQPPPRPRHAFVQGLQLLLLVADK